MSHVTQEQYFFGVSQVGHEDSAAMQAALTVARDSILGDVV